jgi:hypothetical protein
MRPSLPTSEISAVPPLKVRIDSRALGGVQRSKQLILAWIAQVWCRTG